MHLILPIELFRNYLEIIVLIFKLLKDYSVKSIYVNLIHYCSCKYKFMQTYFSYNFKVTWRETVFLCAENWSFIRTWLNIWLKCIHERRETSKLSGYLKSMFHKQYILSTRNLIFLYLFHVALHKCLKLLFVKYPFHFMKHAFCCE